jgi:hypothetical protein
VSGGSMALHRLIAKSVLAPALSWLANVGCGYHPGPPGSGAHHSLVKYVQAVGHCR